MELVCILLAVVTLHTCIGYDITILHTGDVHSRIQEANTYGGTCTGKETDGCYGGLARQKTIIDQERAKAANSLLLDSGDQYFGTLWFYTLGGSGVAEFTNYLKYDAGTFGTHEFDNGSYGLLPFLDNVNYKILACNVKTEVDTPLYGKYDKSHVFTVGGEKIGVIGYTTLETRVKSMPDPDIIFEDEIIAIRREVDMLLASGVNKIIAYGSSTFEKNKMIASSIPGLDIVVGGFDNALLFTGDLPSWEKAIGPYPYIATQNNGAKVLLVQSGAYGKYLGSLSVTFDNDGVAASWSGNPIILDQNVTEDAATLTYLEPFQKQVTAATHDKLALSQVQLQGDWTTCRVRECNMGNLITDAMVRANLRHNKGENWNNVSIAVFNAGGIRASMDRGDISIATAAAVLPYSNSVDIIEIKGKYIREMMEHSISKHETTTFGGYLQMSGLKVEYDVLDKPVGKRVVHLQALCTKCTIPVYEDVVDDDVYQLILSSFMVTGGDGYTMIKDHTVRHLLKGDLILDVLIQYMSRFSPLINAEEGRVTYTEHGEHLECPVNTASTLMTATFLFIIPLINIYAYLS